MDTFILCPEFKIFNKMGRVLENYDLYPLQKPKRILPHDGAARTGLAVLL